MTPHASNLSDASYAGEATASPVLLVMVEVNRSGFALPMMFIPNHVEYCPPVDNYTQDNFTMSRNVAGTGAPID